MTHLLANNVIWSYLIYLSSKNAKQHLLLTLQVWALESRHFPLKYNEFTKKWNGSFNLILSCIFMDWGFSPWILGKEGLNKYLSESLSDKWCGENLRWFVEIVQIGKVGDWILIWDDSNSSEKSTIYCHKKFTY